MKLAIGIGTSAATLLVAALVAGALAVDKAVDNAIERHDDTPQIEEKRAHFLEVVRELEARDTSGLSPDALASRRTALERLRRYAERGVFTVNRDFPQREVPYFIDDTGRRCALAHLIERSGEGALLSDLARHENNAYISQLRPNRKLAAWLDQNGLTPEEIAYIQGPGLIIRRPLDGFTGPSGLVDPARAGSGSTQPQTSPTPTTSRASTPARGRGASGSATVTRRAAASTNAPSWHMWWELNRDAFVNLRTHYHGRQEATKTQSRDGTPRTSRPNRHEIAHGVMSVLNDVAKDRDLTADALMAMARGADKTTAPLIVARILKQLRRVKAAHRDFLVLALGVTRHPDAVEPLIDLLRDRTAGRRRFGQTSKLPQRTRSIAAIALGQCGGDASVDALIATLAAAKGAKDDLKASCIASLGLLGRDARHHDRVVTFLERALSAKKWSATVRAAIPMALARSGADGAKLIRIVKRFRGARELRQSAAIAVGMSGPFDRDTTRALMRLARRDPDASARHFAIMAVSELALRHEGEAEPEVVAAVARFHLDGISAFFKQRADRAWYALAGAVFGRRFPSIADRMTSELEKLATKGRATTDRAAASIGLGLLGAPAGTKTLRALFQDESSPAVRAYVAEALGMAGDQERRDDLLAVSRNAASPVLRYHAAIGLGFLADAASLDPVLIALRETKSDEARSALTRAIGEIADRRSIDVLAEMARDDTLTDLARGRALGALGLLAQPDDTAWNHTLKRGFNFAAPTATMRLVTSIF